MSEFTGPVESSTARHGHFPVPILPWQNIFVRTARLFDPQFTDRTIGVYAAVAGVDALAYACSHEMPRCGNDDNEY